MARVLITGAAGFIGYHLTQHLLTRPEHTLVLADNLRRGTRDAEFEAILDNPRVQFHQVDLTLPSSWATLGSGFQAVYHLAALNGTRLFYEIPHEVLRVNTLSLLYALEWMRQSNPAGAFLFTSSNEAYAGGLVAFGHLPIPTPEAVPLVIEDPYNPRWSYAASKLLGEVAVIHYAHHYRLRACIVRPHNFYGPRAGYDHVIPELSRRIAERVEPFPLYGPDDTRAFCYITDAVEAMQRLMDSAVMDRQPPETVHIGSARELTVRELAEELFTVAGWRPPRIEERPARTGSVARRCGDVTKIQQLIQWRARTPLADGLRATYEWYRQRPPLEADPHHAPAAR